MILDSTKLRKFRDDKQLTQEEIAFNLGVSQTTISEWEKKDTNVKLEHL
jgi:transcriptional regulator with XRE-family HTH domain